MLDVALLSVIRRWYFREGLSKREIARRTGLSRNTLKKYLSQEQVEPAYPQRACVSKLDAFETLLTEALEREVKKPRKQRKTVKQLYHELVPQGLHRFVRQGGSLCPVVASAADGQQTSVCAATVRAR